MDRRLQATITDEIDYREVAIKTGYVIVGVPLAVVCIPVMIGLYWLRVLRDKLR